MVARRENCVIDFDRHVGDGFGLAVRNHQMRGAVASRPAREAGRAGNAGVDPRFPAR